MDLKTARNPECHRGKPNQNLSFWGDSGNNLAGRKKKRGYTPLFLLLTDFQLGNDSPVTCNVSLHEVVKKTTTFTNQQHQATAAGMIFRVCLQMFGDVIDTAGENCNLNFRFPGIFGIIAMFADDFLFDFFC